MEINGIVQKLQSDSNFQVFVYLSYQVSLVCQQSLLPFFFLFLSLTRTLTALPKCIQLRVSYLDLVGFR